jgi:hypothetical protein
MFKVFPVNKEALRPFRGHITFPLFADINETLPFTWNTNDTQTLVNTFKQQLEENVYTFIQQNINCAKLLENHIFNNDFFIGLSQTDATAQCLKFVNPEIRKGYEDTFYKDAEVFAEEGEKTSQVFAVVMLSEDYVYQGHIYTWFTDKSCIAFGIRGRPDKAFIKKEQKSVANELIYKIHEIALAHGCTKVIVPNPLPIMKTMLTEKLEFMFKRIDVTEIGNSFVGYVPDNRPTVGACIKYLSTTSVGGNGKRGEGKSKKRKYTKRIRKN